VQLKRVLRLPMRDGNEIPYFVSPPKSLGFLDYL